MLTGRVAFAGETISDTIAADPGARAGLVALPASTPARRIRRLLRRCLEKDPRQRLRDIGDARIELDSEPEPDGAGGLPASGLSRRRVLAGGVALGLLGIGAGAGGFVWGRARRSSSPSYHRLTYRRGLIRTARFAPDYQTVLYGALWEGDVCRVYSVRPESPASAPLNLPPATPLAVSSSGELAVALGPHLRGIMTYGTLARVPLAGGAPREMLEATKFADWSPDGRDLAVVRRTGNQELLEFAIGNVVAETSTPGSGFSFPRVSPGRRPRGVSSNWSVGLAGRVEWPTVRHQDIPSRRLPQCLRAGLEGQRDLVHGRGRTSALLQTSFLP